MKLAAVTDDYRPASDYSPGELDALTGSTNPRIATPRYAGMRSLGNVMTALDDVTGIELFGWQTLAADRAMQVDAAGGWLASTVGVVVARQNGKTLWAARRILAGLFVLGDHQIIHLAQDRALPREVFAEVATVISDTPDLHRYLAVRGGIRYTNGQESIRLKDGATYRILAPTESAVRGYSRVGFVLMDEARTQTDTSVWSAVAYTQRAHPNPTRWLISNAGDPDSVVLNRLRDRGHAAADDPGSDPAVCWLEWSAPPDSAIDDPVAAWAPANPALGQTIRGTTLLEELRNDEPDAFRTEALCMWVDTTTSNAIPWAAWEAAADRELPPVHVDESVWFGIDLDPERAHAALILAAHVDGQLVVGLQREWLANGDDVVPEDEIADDVRELWETWGPIGIAYDPNTCGGLVDRLPGLPWEPVTGSDWVVACGQTLDAVVGGALVHGDQPSFNAQVAVAGRRDHGDGTWRMSRKDSNTPIPAAVALARVVHLTAKSAGVGITVLD